MPPVQPKTGTLSGAVQAVVVNGPVRNEIGMNSGMNVLGQGNRRYVFSVLCNDTGKAKGGTATAKKLQEDLCKILATWKPATTEPDGS